jgi:hypothetical protein
MSNPTPSSVTSNRSLPSPSESVTVAREAEAYFATFCRASRHEKYTAASASRTYRPIPSPSTVTGTADLRACDSSAATSPWSASKGG